MFVLSLYLAKLNINLYIPIDFGTNRFKKIINRACQIALPLVLGAAILWWTYHDFDFRRVWSVLDGGMNYGWMAFSLVFGVFGHLFRGWRWNLTLAPLGEYPKLSNSVYAVFISYAANLVVPRVGEVSRCGILAKYDGVSFSKSLGTVVTERFIDSICVMLITVVTLLLQSRIFAAFFEKRVRTWDFYETLYLYQFLHYLDLPVCGWSVAALSDTQTGHFHESAEHLERCVGRMPFSPSCETAMALYFIYYRYMGLLLLAVLCQFLLFRLFCFAGLDAGAGDVRSRKYCGGCAHSQRGRSVAFCGYHHDDDVRSR